MTQFADQVRIRLIPQLVKRISKVLQKLLNFNGIVVFAFIIPSLLVFSNNFHLNLNDSDFVITLPGSSLQN